MVRTIPNSNIMKPMNVTAAPAFRKSCDVRMWNDIVLSFLNLSSILFTYVAYFIRFSIQSD
ncbi:hypothetical protein MTHERMMSTA1_21070 [Methanosarcina thermophila MST-A1]|uniref:Uncharacterized protein n=1 Tax=Methanosarcina thermophila TaxID=2210 RepID=A0A3G9CSF1_METTE|nr:conserved hypothetical protein [Methanosarcina thermophila]GLI14981.1 hypothetical protein MTHERMMSTA1_21070 [Methanosarcina thermophila MST-A1]